MTPYDLIETFGLVGDDWTPPAADHDAIAQMAQVAIAGLMEALAEAGLERIGRSVGWGAVNAVHREIEKLERAGDDNARRIRDLDRDQDGSEVMDVELQTATLLQSRMEETREALVTFRESAAAAYAEATGEPWLPRSGSRAGRGVAAAQIDARAMLKAARDRRAAELNPEGPRFVVAGPVKWTDVGAVFAALDALRARRPDMVLVTKGAGGVELVARKWAALRETPSVVVATDWTKGSRAPFKAVDEQLALKPAGVVVFEAPDAALNGIVKNLIEKAEARRIRVWRVGGAAAASSRAA